MNRPDPLNDPNHPWRRQRPTERQETFLRRYGFWRDGLTRGEASTIIGDLLETVKKPGARSLDQIESDLKLQGMIAREKARAESAPSGGTEQVKHQHGDSPP